MKKICLLFLLLAPVLVGCKSQNNDFIIPEKIHKGDKVYKKSSISLEVIHGNRIGICVSENRYSKYSYLIDEEQIYTYKVNKKHKEYNCLYVYEFIDLSQTGKLVLTEPNSILYDVLYEEIK